MRFSGLSLVTTIAISAALSTPAAAQAWLSPPGPLQASNGDRVCILYSGEAPPLVGVQVYADHAQLVLKAAELRGISTGHNATLAFPSGATVPVALFKTSVDNDMALVPIPRSVDADPVGLDDVINQFTAGTFSLTGAGLHIEVGPLPDTTIPITLFRACLTHLDNG